MCTVTIKIIDNIYAQITDGLEHVQKILEYEAEYWTQGKFRKERQVYIKKAHKNGKILAGLVPYIEEYCEKQKIDCEVEQNDVVFPTFEDKELLGTTLREDQKRLVQVAIKKHRGILVAPTGSGKTIIISSLINKYPTAKVLVLTHTVSLTEQIYQTLVNFSIDCGRFTGKFKELGHRVTCTTIQTAVKKYNEKPDIIIIDEAHHCNSATCNYGKLLTKLDSPIKLGFTATPQTDGEAFFAQTGLLGKIISELTWEEASDVGILAIPKIVFIKTPENKDMSKITKYTDAVDIGINNNNRRTKMLVKKVKEYIDNGKSSLILIQSIEHGKNIQAMAKIFGIDIKMVQGSLDPEIREQIKIDLENKKIMSVISTSCWYEGISVRSVDSIFLASPIKKPAALLQRIGRGLRKTLTKNRVEIVDFLDLNSKFFVFQLGHRLHIYSNRNWL